MMTLFTGISPEEFQSMVWITQKIDMTMSQRRPSSNGYKIPTSPDYGKDSYGICKFSQLRKNKVIIKYH